MDLKCLKGFSEITEILILFNNFSEDIFLPHNNLSLNKDSRKNANVSF